MCYQGDTWQCQNEDDRSASSQSLGLYHPGYIRPINSIICNMLLFNVHECDLLLKFATAY